MTFGDNVNFTEVEVPDDDNQSVSSDGNLNVFSKETRKDEVQMTNFENELRKRSRSKRKRKEPERPYHRDKKRLRDEVNL